MKRIEKLFKKSKKFQSFEKKLFEFINHNSSRYFPQAIPDNYP